MYKSSKIFLTIFCVIVIKIYQVNNNNITLNSVHHQTDNKQAVEVRNCVSSFSTLIQCFRTRNLLTCLKSLAFIRGLNVTNQNQLIILESIINYFLKSMQINDIVRLKMVNVAPLSDINQKSIQLIFQITPINSDRELSRKMKMKMSNVVGMMLVPPLIVAGLVPFIVPGISMAVFVNSILNNMAFTSALFTFIRSSIFESDTHQNIIYVNHGYPKNIHKHKLKSY